MSALAAGELAVARRALPAWTITAVLAAVYLILAPASPDLAAASYRSDLFARTGLTLWDNSWYGGHHLPAYSILAPPLGALVDPRLVAALSMTAAAALFAALIDGRFPRRATRLAAAWFALGAGIGLLSSRVAFDLGLAIGLGSLLLAQRSRWRAALALALLSSLASPVAGAFLALAFLAWALAGPVRARPAALAVAALAPIGLLALAFPEGGTQPFVASAFYPALVGVIVVGVLIPPEQRELRIGALLYAFALTGSYLLDTAVGGNSDRLGSLAAGPLAACVLASPSARARGGRFGHSPIPRSRHPVLRSRRLSARARGERPRRPSREWALIVLAPFLLYWQANAPVADFAAVSSDPGVNASYYAPLLGELRALHIGYGGRPARIEAVPTTDHWEARFLAPQVPLARGWERQLDSLRNALFYEESRPLTAARYRTWLARSAVSFVALPDAPLDYSARAEARLLRGGPPPYLREVWRSAHWRLFAVLGATPLAQPPAVVRSLTTDSLAVYAPRAGAYTVRVRFTPYWALASGSGCVARAPGDWTRIEARRAGSFHVVIRFSLARLLAHGPRCE